MINEKIFGIYSEYFNTVKKTNESATEYTHRTAFENLLNAIKPDKNLNIIHEPKKFKGDEGKPDFQIFKEGLLIGYIEMKPVGTDLNKIMEKDSQSRESKQLQRYLKVSPTLILSNYTDFVLFQKGIKVKAVTLFNIKDKLLDSGIVVKTQELFNYFFLSKPQEVTSPEKLSELLAERTKIFKDIVYEIINSTSTSQFKDKLIGPDGLYEVLKRTLIDDLSLDEFADAYVQTITYGLILARLNSSDSITEVTAPSFIPKSVGTIRELFKTIEIDEIPPDIGWIIDAIIVILNSINRKRFDEILSFKKPYTYEDPYVYFYEKFLAEYDKKKRKAMGVYYTPIPIVWYIIKSINQILRKEFKVDGLKESDVTVLDFATGTGTFLLEAYKKAIQDTDIGTRPRLIKEHLLKHFYGFEYLIAPYTIAHLKLSQFMKDNGYDLGDDERIKVYLTDTLDNDLHKRYAIFPKMSEEGEEAYKIKMKHPILVVTGNPPYSNFSRNNKPWIKELIKTYKEGLEERKINLDDDYIKFLRYAQWKIEQTGNGIVGVITNNSYLDGITHREMRHKLLQTFDKIYILNLHGNGNKGETDQNVFDIKVGVAIVLFVKLSKPIEEKEIYYYSITENGKTTTRKEKFDFLLRNDYSTVNWKRINPKDPYYWFINKDERHEAEYNNGIFITDIFNLYSTGVETGKDSLVIDFDQEKLKSRINEILINPADEKIQEKYNLTSMPNWNPDIFKNAKFQTENFIKINYRPFDSRYIFYDKYALHRNRYEVMINMLNNNNIGISFSKTWDIKSLWSAVFVSDIIIDEHYVGGKSYFAPLYLIKKVTNTSNLKQDKLFKKKNQSSDYYSDYYANLDVKPNFKSEFIQFLSKKYNFYFKPEEVFYYVYAILNSPAYRKKYYEFLKINYPKIPFVDDLTKFKKLASLGQKLVELHLLKISKADSKLAEFKEKGNDYIEKVRYDAKTEKLYINATQYFDNIPEEIWNFEIGGYQVLYKWLNERKGMHIHYQEQVQFKKITYALKETLKLMQQIDIVYLND